MALRCLKRNDIDGLYKNTQNLELELEAVKQNETKKRKREQIFWEISNPLESDMQRKETQRLRFRDQLLLVKSAVLMHIPDILSRLELAAASLFTEIARGFFLPFNSVALGAVARIRMLLLRLSDQLIRSMPAWKLNYSSIYTDEAPLWSSQQLYQAQEQIHALSKSIHDEKLSKQQRVDLFLNQLGEKEGAGLSEEQVKDQSDEIDSSTQPVSLYTSVTHADRKDDDGDHDDDDDDDDDMGEQLLLETPELDDQSVTLQPTASAKMLRQQNLDCNHALVVTVSRLKQETKGKRVKAKDVTSDDGEKRSRKKKKEGSSKGDFFDELFG
jgi:hypothetical protein